MKIKLIIFSLLIFGITGYFRERFFEHFNIIMAGVYRGTDEYAIINTKVPVLMAPFTKWSYATLYYSKYVFTLIWIIVFFIIGFFTLKRLTISKNILKFFTWSYLILLILAGISMTLGYIVNNTLKNDEYTLSRWLLGIAQSPIICLILLASENLYKKSFQSHPKN